MPLPEMWGQWSELKAGSKYIKSPNLGSLNSKTKTKTDKAKQKKQTNKKKHPTQNNKNNNNKNNTIIQLENGEKK